MGIFSFLKNNKDRKEKSNFNVIISSAVLEDVRTLLNKQNKTALRLVASRFCCSGGNFEVVLDDQKENDLLVEQDGVKFVINNNYKKLIGTVEIIKINNKITVKNY